MRVKIPVAIVLAVLLLVPVAAAAPVTFPASRPGWYSDAVAPGSLRAVYSNYTTVPDGSLTAGGVESYTNYTYGAWHNVSVEILATITAYSAFLELGVNSTYALKLQWAATYLYLYSGDGVTNLGTYDKTDYHTYFFVLRGTNFTLYIDGVDKGTYSYAAPPPLNNITFYVVSSASGGIAWRNYTILYGLIVDVLPLNPVTPVHGDGFMYAVARAPSGTVLTYTNASEAWLDEAYINQTGTYVFTWVTATQLAFYNASEQYTGLVSARGSWGVTTVNLSETLLYLPLGDTAAFNATDLDGNSYTSAGSPYVGIRLFPPGQPLYTITVASYTSSEEVYAVLRDRYGYVLWAGYTSPTNPIYVKLPYLEPFSVSVVEGGVEKVIANLVADSQLSKTVYIGFSYQPTYIGRVYLKATLVNDTTLRVELTAPEPVTANVTVYKYNGTSRVEVASIVFAEPATAHVAYVYLPEGDPFFEVVGDVTGENLEGTVRTYAGTSIPAATAPPESLTPSNATRLVLRDLPPELYALGPERIAVWAAAMLALLVFAAGSLVGLGLIAASLTMYAGTYLLGGAPIDYATATTLFIAGAILLYTKREE